MKKSISSSIMIIDDNEIDIFINKRVIEYTGFSDSVISMTSASSALEYLKEGVDLPDLILLDLNMPVMDGFRFLYEFSNLPDPIRKSIAIVVLTSSNNDRDKEKAAANPDVKYFLSKPLTEDKLVALGGVFYDSNMQ